MRHFSSGVESTSRSASCRPRPSFRWFRVMSKFGVEILVRTIINNLDFYFFSSNRYTSDHISTSPRDRSLYQASMWLVWMLVYFVGAGLVNRSHAVNHTNYGKVRANCLVHNVDQFGVAVPDAQVLHVTHRHAFPILPFCTLLSLLSSRQNTHCLQIPIFWNSEYSSVLIEISYLSDRDWPWFVCC